MNDNIENYLKDSANLDEFINQAGGEIANIIGKDTGRASYNILEAEIEDMAREIWDEFVNSNLPF